MIPLRFDAGELKLSADFVAIASRYTRLHRAGGQYVGLCPFHAESTPSLYVEPERKIWKCFGCGRGGDVFNFIVQAEGCGFSRALEIVAGIVSGSEPRSGERFAANERGAAPLAREAGGEPSQPSRAALIARLDATERRLEGIRATNEAGMMELATACEPRSGEPLLETTG